ncbi:unnamed protein product [Adineta steineri]|uniref:Uncharacterized protein n=1 Tax=Adineta steineri TaxID=433720 RepID=A0A815KI72_9BILA|nr:unnamed protein product [Adineta steineri]CAF4169105.1 unnamed protein product [Adineta steineri]
MSIHLYTQSNSYPHALTVRSLEGFFALNSFNKQYTGPSSYELHQQQQQQQNYTPPSQQHASYSSSNFTPSQYNINSQGLPNQFYRSDDYFPQPTNVTNNCDDEELPVLEEFNVNFDYIFK